MRYLKRFNEWYDSIEGTKMDWIFSFAFIFVGGAIVVTIESLV